jgi:DNA-binding response OmpR family regulator
MAAAARICLIDDDTFARNALTLALEDAGFEVLPAPGAAAGFDAVNRNGADAIITDMNMPGTDGAELISQARAAWPKIPIVAISGSSVVGERSLMDVARDRGADAALAKPFTVSQLTALLNPLLEKSKA